MEQCECLRLMKGATNIVQVDLTDFDMQGGSVVMTMSGPDNKAVKTWEFTEAGLFHVVIEDDFTAGLMCGNYNYKYDLMWHVDGCRYAQCLPSPIIVTNTVGGCHNG